MSSCPKGQIRRKSYKRGNTRVPATCVKDMGEPGRGRKTLPPLGDDVSLSRFGYSVKKSKKERQKSLKRASKKHGSLEVLRRLNLARNYQSVKKTKKKMSEDVEFMSRHHARTKRKSRKSRKSRKGSRKRR